MGKTEIVISLFFFINMKMMMVTCFLLMAVFYLKIIDSCFLLLNQRRFGLNYH